METNVSIGTGLARTRCCQPAASRRFASTCRNPVSESRTARRMGTWPGAISASIARARDAVTPCRGAITTWSHLARGAARIPGRVRELAKQPRDDERDLLADVDRVVADPLERARDEHHRHRPFAAIGVRPDLDRPAEALAVEAVDPLVLADEVLGEPDVAQRKGLLGLLDLRAHDPAHLLDAVERRLVDRRLVPGQRQELR